MDAINLTLVNLFVLYKQHLSPSSKGEDVVQIVKDVGGLHATSSITPYLSLYARFPQFEKEDLDLEMHDKRTLGKVRCVRKTIYIHPKDRIPIVWKATVGKVIAESKGFMTNRGVSEEMYDKLSKDILQMLRGREMSVAEIKATLRTEADVSSILYFMCDQGLLIRGRPVKGWRDRRHRYARFNDYFPDTNLEGLKESEAVTELVRLYLASFGPASEIDIAWWTGLGKTKVRRALNEIESQLVDVSITEIGERLFMLRSDEADMRALKLPKEPVINLLPHLDPYLMGYKERKRYLDQAYYDLVFDRVGNATSTILVDGKVVGVWDFEGSTEPLAKIFLFQEIGKDLRDEIFAEAGHLGEFIAGLEAKVKECESMVPLTERTAGSMMSPLKGCS